jgi:preprotein translocase subunit SecD
LTIAVAPQGSATMAELRRDYRVVGARLRSLNLGSARLLGNHILITAPTKDLAQAQSIATDPGNLRFRQVLALHPSASATANPAVNRAVSVTPALMTSLAHWDCQTNPNPTGGTDSAKNYMLACNVKRSRVYLLAPASLDGGDVQAASAGLDYQPTLPEGSEAPTPGEVLDVPNGTPWVVNLKFTRSGAARWLALTEKTYEVSNGPASGYPDCVPPKGCNAVGITLDGIVESDPATEVDGIPGGLTVISGNFSQAEADRLAAVLRGGSLPVPLHVVG